IENRFKADFLVEQIMVVGDKQKFVSAIIVPAVEPLKEWCKKNGVEWVSVSEAIQNDKVISRYEECCHKYNPEFSHIEQIKKFALTDKQWEATKVDGTKAELTPTMKLKRRVILEKHQEEIDKIYNE
ncbi:MAG: long-chain fatty acid--CoA ligase, partial [Saprospiraceae bacterium]|nr:long-chain fatty acid--CoA ligase [Saprospiraceae bacterium]